MKIIQWAKEAWIIFPFMFVINILARIFIGSAVVDAYANMSSGGSLIIVKIVIILWMLSPLYYPIRRTYYELQGGHPNEF